ncbi:glycoprotein [Entomohabitans teleogrylli]|uniref:glycoprotein n=1 Tax=Entomohabitans teleogrylli TaxID=1384589 RepID=UPI0008FCADCD|nr:glycoprotein [Entomohabitans teleogrylli]
MAKYEVVRPWHGVALGDVVEFEKLHPSLKSHLRPISSAAAASATPAAEVTPATPAASSNKEQKKS